MHRPITMMGGNNKLQANLHHRSNNNNPNQVHTQLQHLQQQHQHSHHQSHHSTGSAFGTHPADLNPMDFIEQDIITSGGGSGGAHHSTGGSGGMISNHSHNINQVNSGGLVTPNFDVNLEAPFDMMSAFPDLDPSQFGPGVGGGESQHSPLLLQNVPGPMLGSSPMNTLIKNEGGIGMNSSTRSQQMQQHTSSQQLRTQHQNQNNPMHHINHQHHPDGHPHISDYSPEWGWTDVSKSRNILNTRSRRYQVLYILKTFFTLFQVFTAT